MAWLRLYDDIIDDPKVLQLSWEFRWHFVEILAISSRQKVRGTLPDVKQIALHMRLTVGRAARVVQRFIDLGFIDANRETGELTVHGWDKRQFESDNVTARTRAFRKRSRAAHEERSGNVPGNDSGTDQRQIQIQSQKEKDFLPSRSSPESKSPRAPTRTHAKPPGNHEIPPRDPALADQISPTLHRLAARNKLNQGKAPCADPSEVR